MRFHDPKHQRLSNLQTKVHKYARKQERQAAYPSILEQRKEVSPKDITTTAIKLYRVSLG